MAGLYTRKGDDGQTVLFEGTVVRKDDQRVVAYGTVDELNAHLGVVIGSIHSRAGEAAWKALRERLVHVQNELLALGAELATPAGARNRDKVAAVTAGQVSRLETWIDEATAPLPELKTFVLPGGDIDAARLHVCRTVCRRAERCAVAAAEGAAINPQVVIYLNRLSDLLFVWARLANHLAGVSEVPWSDP